MVKYLTVNKDSGNDIKGSYEGQTEDLIKTSAELELASVRCLKNNKQHIAKISTLSGDSNLTPVDYATAKKNIEAIRKIRENIGKDTKSLVDSFRKINSNDNSSRMSSKSFYSFIVIYAYLFGTLGALFIALINKLATKDASSKTKMAFNLLKKNISELRSLESKLRRFELQYINYIKASTKK